MCLNINPFNSYVVNNHPYNASRTIVNVNNERMLCAYMVMSYQCHDDAHVDYVQVSQDRAAYIVYHRAIPCNTTKESDVDCQHKAPLNAL